MNLRGKILAGYLAVFVILSIVILWSLVNIVNLGKAADAILRENYRSISASENMISSLSRQEVLILRILQGDSVNESITLLNREEENFLEWLIKSRDNITIAGEEELVSRIREALESYREDLLPFIQGQPGFLNLSYYGDTLEIEISRISSFCLELKELNEKSMYDSSRQAEELSRTALISTLVLALLSLVAALGISIYISNKIVQPLISFSEASRNLAEGDYHVRVGVDTKDELGKLAVDFNQMAAKLGRFHAMNIDQLFLEKNKADAILASIEDGLVVLDQEGNISGINPAAGRILNKTLSLNLTLSCEEILPETMIPALVRSLLQNGMTRELPEEERIIPIQEQDGRTRHFLFSITKIQEAQKPVSGVIVMFRDVTRMKELENLKSEFVMAASHELKTPLTSLCMSIDLIKDQLREKVTPDENELIETAREEIFHMRSLTEDLLELSRLESGQIDIEKEKVSARHLLDYIRDIFAKQIGNSGKSISIEIPSGDLLFRGDEIKISWVLSNLISNALRYIGDKGKIKLSAVKIGFNVHFSVEDDGLGIPEEYQSRIFQKFSTIKGRTSGGSGLGLAICKEIIRAHGGTIWVESKPGKGSIFTFSLPHYE